MSCSYKYTKTIERSVRTCEILIPFKEFSSQIIEYHYIFDIIHSARCFLNHSYMSAYSHSRTERLTQASTLLHVSKIKSPSSGRFKYKRMCKTNTMIKIKMLKLQSSHKYNNNDNTISVTMLMIY
jgi:hypothetical protein